MKKNYTFLIIFIIFFTFPGIINSQNATGIWKWSDEVRITSGFNDSNPKFGNRVYPTLYPIINEFLIFQRTLIGYSNIFLYEFKSNGIVNPSPINLSNNFSINRNASISYNKPYLWLSPDSVITNSLVVWETNRNGNWDIYGKKYDFLNGWRDIIIDDDSSDKFNPDVIHIEGSRFLVTYEKNNDIFIKSINTMNDSTEFVQNVTNTNSLFEKNPRISHYSSAFFKIVLSFEKIKPDGKSSLYFCKSTIDSLNFSSVYLLDSTGHNSNLKYFNEYSNLNYIVVYEKQTNNQIKLIGKSITNYNNFIEDLVVINDISTNVKNYSNFHWPAVVNSEGQVVHSYAGIYQKTIGNTSKLILGVDNFYDNFNDTTDLGDSSYNSNVTINYGLKLYPKLGPLYKIFAIYTKDSAGTNSIYMKGIEMNVGSVSQISSSIPNSFILYQNYPNPFNAGTKIRFAVKDNNTIVNLSVYDVSGRLIKNLVNDKFNAGEYEYFYDADGLSSGVYFYSLQAGEFSETRRMVLVK